jgi:hypothetical protein
MTDMAVPAKIRLNKDLDIEDPVGKLYLHQRYFKMLFFSVQVSGT